jgi:hypothetical protein
MVDVDENRIQAATRLLAELPPPQAVVDEPYLEAVLRACDELVHLVQVEPVHGVKGAHRAATVG